MKAKFQIVLWWVGIPIALLICLLFLVHYASNYQRDIWVTLEKARTTTGGCCFVRQMGDPFPFCNVGFGYINQSGIQYSYLLEHETFPWKRVHLVEKGGIIRVMENGREVAVFNPTNGYFTNLVAKRTFDEKDGLSGGYGSSFFELEPK